MPNWLDITVLVVMLAFAVNSVFRGFLRELVALVGIIASTYLAIRLYDPLSQLLPFYQGNSGAAHAVTFTTILLLGWIVSNLLGFSLRRLARESGLDWADALGGMIFGLAKGILLVSIALLLTLWLGDARLAAVIRRSRLSSLMTAEAERIWDLVAR